MYCVQTCTCTVWNTLLLLLFKDASYSHRQVRRNLETAAMSWNVSEHVNIFLTDQAYVNRAQFWWLMWSWRSFENCPRGERWGQLGHLEMSLISWSVFVQYSLGCTSPLSCLPHLSQIGAAWVKASALQWSLLNFKQADSVLAAETVAACGSSIELERIRTPGSCCVTNQSRCLCFSGATLMLHGSTFQRIPVHTARLLTIVY